MSSPYITPVDLVGNWSPSDSPGYPSDYAPLGVSWNTLSTGRQAEVCVIASMLLDDMCGADVRAGLYYEELSGPSHRLAVPYNGIARFLTSRKPITSVVMAQFALAGQIPYQWQSIPANACVPEEVPMTNFGSTAPSGASSTMAAILIGGGRIGWAYGRNSTRVGVQYISGWPHCGLLPAATTSATFETDSESVTVTSNEGIVPGALLSGPGIAADCIILDVDDLTLTISEPTTEALSGVTVAIGYAPGATALNVDDVTAWPGAIGTIYDGADTEVVTGLSVVANTAGLNAPSGPGVLTLASGLKFPHGSNVVLSSMPQTLRWAVMLLAKFEALERGSTSTTVGSVPGRSTGSGGNGQDSSWHRAERIVRAGNFRRVV